MELQGLVERTVNGLGYELVDIELSNHRRMLRIFIDRPARNAVGMAENAVATERDATGTARDAIGAAPGAVGTALGAVGTAPGAVASGITVEDCARVSNQLTRVLEVEDIDYERLEVSSPGLDRPLKKEADFARFTGERARLTVRVPVEGRRNFNGVMRAVADGKLQLEIEGGMVELDLANIDKARLVPKVAF